MSKFTDQDPDDAIMAEYYESIQEEHRFQPEPDYTYEPTDEEYGFPPEQDCMRVLPKPFKGSVIVDREGNVWMSVGFIRKVSEFSVQSDQNYPWPENLPALESFLRTAHAMAAFELRRYRFREWRKTQK